MTIALDLGLATSLATGKAGKKTSVPHDPLVLKEIKTWSPKKVDLIENGPADETKPSRC